MHVLLCNDDGVEAPGICDLSIALPDEWRITIIAPDSEQSAKSHALTVNRPLKLKKLPSYKANITRYSLSGTPADCMKFALDYYMKEDKPDLLISGVNNGYNLGSDALYSGTVGAAMEGLFYKIPSIALSLKHYDKIRGEEIFPFVSEFIEEVFVRQKFQGMLNMNLPLSGEVGWDRVKVVDQGMPLYSNIFEEYKDANGDPYYYLRGILSFDENENEGTDVDCIEKGYITVNALTWRQIAGEEMEALAHIVEAKK